MRNATAVFLETALVATAGLVLALAANALSPRGLRLNRNYFPDGKLTAQVGEPAASGPARTNAVQPPDATRARLQQHGLQLVSSNQVAVLFHDSRYEQGLVVFVDARDDNHYQAGHIPGAWQFDHYRAENYFAAVLPVCLNAQTVVVYCAGGECEDSEFAAVMLRDAGVPRENLFVFAGGFTEWTGNKLPVEAGARQSGQWLQSKP